jgi:hypothetical protein
VHGGEISPARPRGADGELAEPMGDALPGALEHGLRPDPAGDGRLVPLPLGQAGQCGGIIGVQDPGQWADAADRIPLHVDAHGAPGDSDHRHIAGMRE